MEHKRTWLERLRCWLGLHIALGITMDSQIRCYGCGKEYDPIKRLWYQRDEQSGYTIFVLRRAMRQLFIHLFERGKMKQYEVGQTNDIGMVLIFDRWTEQPSKRIRVWRLSNGDITIEVLDIVMQQIAQSVSLTSYRADDLAKALTR